jgi:hypothetical protein
VDADVEQGARYVLDSAGPSSISRSPSGASPRAYPAHTSPSCLGAEAQLSDVPKIWRKAGSGARQMVQYVSRKGTMIPFHLPHIRGRHANAIDRQVPKSICGVNAPHERMDFWLMGWVDCPITAGVVLPSGGFYPLTLRELLHRMSPEVALGVFRCGAQNFDAIGGTADIDWPPAPIASEANDPKRT